MFTIYKCIIFLLYIEKSYSDDDDPVFRIVEGTNVANVVPYMVSIHYGGSHICGGSLIAPRFVLTAAHCITYSGSHSTLPVANFKLVRGALNIDCITEVCDIRYCNRTYAHHHYVSKHTANDIGLMSLSQAYENVPLVIIGAPNSGTTCTLYGWGRTRGGGQISKHLQQIEITLMSKSECRKKWWPKMIEDTQVCATGTGQQAACHGDSGGPIICQGDIQVGIVSFGSALCKTNKPTVYCRPDQFMDWITRMMNSSKIVTENLVIVVAVIIMHIIF